MTRTQRFGALIISALVSMFLPAVVRAQGKSLSGPEQDLNRALKTNNFCTIRGVKELSELLGPRFAADVPRLGPHQRIIDIGAGEAFFYRTLLEMRGGDRKQMPLVVAVGVKRPDTPEGGSQNCINNTRELLRELRRPGTQLVYEECRLATPDEKRNEATLKKLGKGFYHVAIDGHALGQYTDNYALALKTFGALLAPGGMLYTHMDIGRNQLKTADGKTIPWEFVFLNTKGFEVVDMRRVKIEGAGRERLQIALRRTNGDVVPPPITTKLTKFYTPPWREHTWNGRLPAVRQLRTKRNGPMPLPTI